MNNGFSEQKEYFERIRTFLEISDINIEVSDEEIFDYYNRGVLFSDLCDIILFEDAKEFVSIEVDDNGKPIAFDTEFYTQQEIDVLSDDEKNLLLFFEINRSEFKEPADFWDLKTDVDFDGNRFWLENNE